MTARIGDLRVVASGSAIVEGHEDLVIENEGISLTLRWTRDDDNVVTGGTVDALTADLPAVRPSVGVVHAFSLTADGGERRVEARFHVEWIYEWSRLVSYSLLANF